jgi:hypothetical protein
MNLKSQVPGPPFTSAPLYRGADGTPPVSDGREVT